MAKDEHNNGRPKVPPVLDGLMTDNELGEELDRDPRTLARWRALRVGPKFLRIGRQLFYRRESVRAWLASLEQDA